MYLIITSFCCIKNYNLLVTSGVPRGSHSKFPAETHTLQCCVSKGYCVPCPCLSAYSCVFIKNVLQIPRKPEA